MRTSALLRLESGWVRDWPSDLVGKNVTLSTAFACRRNWLSNILTLTAFIEFHDEAPPNAGLSIVVCTTCELHRKLTFSAGGNTFQSEPIVV